MRRREFAKLLAFKISNTLATELWLVVLYILFPECYSLPDVSGVDNSRAGDLHYR